MHVCPYVEIHLSSIGYFSVKTGQRFEGLAAMENVLGADYRIVGSEDQEDLLILIIRAFLQGP